MDEKQEPRMISAFEHENDMMHLGHANHRLLLALVAVCITFILTIVIFVWGYTVREKNWLNTLTRLTPAASEVAGDGLHKQPDP